VLPLVLKDKVAALVYADAGADGTLDSAALELLVMATGAGLEVISLRKQAQREIGDAASAAERSMPSPPVQTVSSFSDPFGGHVPKHIAPSIPDEPQPGSTAEVVEMPGSVHRAGAAAADPFAALSPED